MARTKNKLTPKQERFCHEYLKDLNATRACVSAGFSEKTADKIASQLLGKTLVLKKIHALKEKLLNKVQVSTEEVLSAVKELAFFDARKAFDEYSNLLPVKDWPPEVARCVAQVDNFEEYEGQGSNRRAVGVVRRVKFWNKPAAIEMLMKYLGLFEKDNAQRELKLESLTINHTTINQTNNNGQLSEEHKDFRTITLNGI